MSPKTPPGNPESSREEAGIEKVIASLRIIFDKAMTPKMEEGLRKITAPTLRMLEALLNPNTNGRKELMLSKLMAVLENK